MPYIQQNTGARRFEAPLRALSAVLFAAALVSAGSAQAAEKSMPAAPTSHAAAGMQHTNPPINQEQFAEFTKTRKELFELRAQLDKIQVATLKAHPELQKRANALTTLVAKVMAKNGYDPKKGIAEIKALQGKLQDPKTPQDKKKALFEQYQAKVFEFNRAKAEVLRDKTVQKERHSLGEAVSAAMKKQDPRVGKLLAEFEAKQKRYVKLRAALFAQAQREVAKGQAAKKAKSK